MGFEPILSEYETEVLPLYYPTKLLFNYKIKDETGVGFAPTYFRA